MSDAHLLSPTGFRAGAGRGGIKTKGLDVGLVVCDAPASAAAMFTKNRVVSAAVTVGRKHIVGGRLCGIVVNSGNANACTGKQGLRDAMRMCNLAGKSIGCPAGEILPSSTGIIGHMLPMEKIEHGIAIAASALGTSAEHATAFADAILTTDLVRKTAGVKFRVGRQPAIIAGVCKGSGMIGPRLGPASAAGGLAGKHATMLAYLTTDVRISPRLLENLLAEACDGSFNAVTVDDHSSTNDTAAILASGAGPAVAGGIASASVRSFRAALREVCQSLAYQIAADGEGATKVVRIDVTGAKTVADARRIARAIANSPLVKCAMHGNDPNWGRIISAAGMCDAAFDADRSRLKMQGTTVFAAGQPAKFDGPAASKALAAPEVVVDLSCGLGKSSATVWTCDLSREYIRINADYHT